MKRCLSSLHEEIIYDDRRNEECPICEQIKELEDK